MGAEAGGWRVALTGGAGCGKSTAAQFFAERGAVVIDADALAHEFMEPGQDANKRIQTTFGTDVCDSEGRIRRPFLRDLVFSDAKARLKLEAILHPLIRDALYARSANAQPYALLVIPLLAETGRGSSLDRVVVVDADPAIQESRLRERGLNPETIQQLLAIQATREQRLALADDVIVNNGSREALEAQVAALDEEYRLRSAGRE